MLLNQSIRYLLIKFLIFSSVKVCYISKVFNLSSRFLFVYLQQKIKDMNKTVILRNNNREEVKNRLKELGYRALSWAISTDENYSIIACSIPCMIPSEYRLGSSDKSKLKKFKGTFWCISPEHNCLENQVDCGTDIELFLKEAGKLIRR